MKARPVPGDTIRVHDSWAGEEGHEHICTVTDLLSTQLMAKYEFARGDGGWGERTLFCFYSDIEWDIRQQEWVGRAG
jgi:hypothetical protein